MTFAVQRGVSLAVVVVLTTAIVGAEQKPAPMPPAQQPVFRSGVDLVTLDVTVVDKDGKPVKGLKAEDFVVTLEGAVRPVRALDFLEFAGTAASDAAAPAAAPESRETTNQTPQAGGGKVGPRFFVFVFDDLSYKPGPGKVLTTHAVDMLAKLDIDDFVGLVTTSGLGPVVNPTRDRSAIIAALKKTIGQRADVTAPFVIGMDEALDTDRWDDHSQLLAAATTRECQEVSFGDSCPTMVRAAAHRLADDVIHRTAMQMVAYQTAIAALRAAPAPKTIIVFSNGVATSPDNELKAQLDLISRAAAEAGVRMYSMTEAEDGADAADTSFARAHMRRAEADFLFSGIQTVAYAAGGEAFHVIGIPDRFFTRIVSETSGLYRLGVEAPVMKDPTKFLNAKVTVKQPGVTVRVNPRTLSSTAVAEPVSIDDRLRAASQQGGVAYGVPIALGTALRQEPASDQLQLAVNVQIPAITPGPLTSMFALVNETGQVVKAGKPAIATSAGDDYWLSFPLPLAAGNYHLRFAVADANGNVGSVEHAVAARLSDLGSLSVSDLFMTWEGIDGKRHFLALENVPAAASVLHTLIELYPHGPMPDPAVFGVRIALLRSGDVTPLLEREISPSRDGQILSAKAELPIDDLNPGTYTIRATVLQDGTEKGTISAVVVKR